MHGSGLPNATLGATAREEVAVKKLIEKKIPKQFLANIIGVLCHRLRLTNRMYMHAKYGTTSKDVKWLG